MFRLLKCFIQISLILSCIVLSTPDESPRKGDWKQIPTAILDVLSTNMKVITALPLSLVATVIDTVCSSAIFIERVPDRSTPDISKLRLQYMKPCFNYSVPFLEAEKLWKHPKFRQNRKLVILATGWTNTINNSDTIRIFAKAFMCRPEVNFVIVDAAHYVSTLYKWSALNTDLIGEYLAVGLQHLIKVRPKVEIHLIGHSLGAHIMGAAGRTFQQITERRVSRITGLDPAKPCFRYEKSLSGLMRGDAKLVDVIHTNIGILAKGQPMGDVDFYPGGVNPIMPGCLTVACSHRRAVEYFAESIYPQMESSFLGVHCSSWSDLTWRRCKAGVTSTMGYIINSDASGIYYVDINRKSPFGKNSNTLNSIDLESGHSECPNFRCRYT